MSPGSIGINTECLDNHPQLFSVNFYTTFPLLNLIVFTSLKHSCLGQLTVGPFLFPPTLSILIFIVKLDAVCMCAVTSLAHAHDHEFSEFSIIWLQLQIYSLTIKYICAVYLT